MEEKKTDYSSVNGEYLRVVPRIGYYLKSLNIAAICKYKSAILGATGDSKTYMFTIWTHRVGAGTMLCKRRGVCEWILGQIPDYMEQTLTGSESPIAAIIRIHNTQIVSGEYKGDLRIWDIDQGICTKHIPSMANSLYQMKQNIGGEVLVSCHNQVNVWDTTNNWENTPKQFSLCDGRSIEFFSQHLLLRGGWNAHLEFIHYRETVCKLPPTIRLHSAVIFGIQKIVQNILLTASMDGYLKVIEPISGECYLKFKKEGGMRAIAYFYQSSYVLAYYEHIQ